jgi:hypothetical protein
VTAAVRGLDRSIRSSEQGRQYQPCERQGERSDSFWTTNPTLEAKPKGWADRDGLHNRVALGSNIVGLMHKMVRWSNSLARAYSNPREDHPACRPTQVSYAINNIITLFLGAQVRRSSKKRRCCGDGPDVDSGTAEVLYLSSFETRARICCCAQVLLSCQSTSSALAACIGKISPFTTGADLPAICGG